MSSGKENSDDRREPVFLTPAAPDAPPSLDPGLLEKVLEKTLDLGDSAEPLDGATRASLLDFARKNGGGAEFSEPLLAGLVGVVLKLELPLLAGQPGGDTIPGQVANSIWEDPVARGRISNLWQLLQGPTP